MNAKTVSPSADVTVADAGVVKALSNATKSAVTAQQTARDAAKLAFRSPAFSAAANRYEQLLSLYRPHLENEVIRQAFSNALAVLCAGDPVRIAAASKTLVGKAETLAFTKPEVLGKGELASDAEKNITVLTAEEAVDKLSKAELTAASKIARTEKVGGGRDRVKGTKTPAKPDHTKRAPFSDEFHALMGDAGGRAVIAGLLRGHGFEMKLLEAAKKMKREAKEPQALDVAGPSEVAALVASMTH